jgi:hypothetical protein
MIFGLSLITSLYVSLSFSLTCSSHRNCQSFLFICLMSLAKVEKLQYQKDHLKLHSQLNLLVCLSQYQPEFAAFFHLIKVRNLGQNNVHVWEEKRRYPIRLIINSNASADIIIMTPAFNNLLILLCSKASQAARFILLVVRAG